MVDLGLRTCSLVSPLWSVLHLSTACCLLKNKLLWPRLRAVQVYAYKHKYLNYSFTAWPFSKMAITALTLRSMSSPVIGFWLWNQYRNGNLCCRASLKLSQKVTKYSKTVVNYFSRYIFWQLTIATCRALLWEKLLICFLSYIATSSTMRTRQQQRSPICLRLMYLCPEVKAEMPSARRTYHVAAINN